MPSKVGLHLVFHKSCYLVTFYSNLLRSQLIPVNNDSHPDVALDTISSSPGINVLDTKILVPVVSVRGAGNQSAPSNSGASLGTSYGRSLPEFRTLSKAHSMPTNLRNEETSHNNDGFKKRNSSEKEDAVVSLSLAETELNV